MCTAESEEAISGGSVSGSVGAGDIPVVTSYAPRIGLDMDVYSAIDWSEVLNQSAIGLVSGALSGNVKGAVAGALEGATSEIEGQEGVDTSDLFEIKNDMIVIEGAMHPYTSLH